MIKKIISWIVFIVCVIASITNIDSDWSVFAVIGAMISITYVIHLYSLNQKIVSISKKIWKYLIPILIIVIVFLFAGFLRSNLLTISVITLIYVFLILSLYLIVAYRKVDLVIIILMGISVIGVVFRNYQIPGAGALFTLCWTVPAVLFMFILYMRINEYDTRTNKFLNFFKNFVSLTLTISFLGITLKMHHWPGGDVFNFIAQPASILAILFLVFLLPASNFIEWTKEHKRLFYRALLIPLLYLSVLNSLGYVFPETFRELIYSESKRIDLPFLSKYDIPYAEGMEKSCDNKE